MNLSDMISNVRIEIQDRDGVVWKDDELEHAIYKSINLMSRLLPRRALASITLTAPMILSDTLLDLSIGLPDFIAIDRMEYPADETPPAILTFDPIGTTIRFRKSASLTVNTVLRVEYQSKWTPPTNSASGNYPSHLEETLIIGAAGQALIFKAELYVKQAATAFSALTAPDAYTFVKPTSPTLGSAPVAPTAPTLDYTAIDTALNAIATALTGSAPSAKAYLELGDDLINANTRGDQVGPTYKGYADSEIAIAQTFRDEALGRLQKVQSDLNKYMGQVNSFASDVNRFSAEVNANVSLFKSQGDIESIGANVYASQVSAFVALVQGQSAKATGLLDVAGRYLASGQSKINEFLTSLGIKPEYRVQRSSAEQRAS